MTATLIYLLKVNIAIALFYMFYRLFFANDTFWKTRRLYLLASIAISFAYPYFSIANWLQNQEPMQALLSNYVQLQEFTVTPNTDIRFFSIENILLISYGFITVLLTVRMLIQLFSILKIKANGHKRRILDVNVIVIDKAITPFSFFGSIYLNPTLHNEHETKQILTHELTHVQQLHSFDVILSELLCIVFWFNPATWLLKREIRQNLEFLADNKVIESGFDSKTYQYHLLQLSYQTPQLKLTNKFNILPLKKRIIMMNQQKSEKSGILKYLLIIPLASTLIITSNAESIISSAKEKLQITETPTVKTIALSKKQDSTTSTTNKIDEVVVVGYAVPADEQQKNTVMTPPPPPPVPSDGKEIFQVVEKMPEYPGGISAMSKFMSENVKYPVDAQKKGTQGRVICSFVVNTDGTIGDIKVVRGIDPSLDAEAVRVINAMPTWTPGTQRGEKVRVQYALPINFSLGGGKDDKQTNTERKQPLIVLDGEALPANFKMDLIKPESIERINVLKDASAIAAYGEKGKNGVIEITSKVKGEE